MFDNKYIENNINIIFDIEQNTFMDKPFFYIEENKHIPDHLKPFIKSPPSRAPRINLELQPEDNFRLEWDTYITLKQLYNKIESEPRARKSFVHIIKDKLRHGYTTIDGTINNGESHDCSSLAFYFLMKIGKNYENIEVLDNVYKSKKYNKSRHGLFADILIFIHSEPAYFDDNTLNRLKELNYQNSYYADSSLKTKFNDLVDSTRYKKLKNDLVGINEELNLDKELIIDIISKYGFPQEMESFLLEIDKIHELSNWESINSGMIGNLRSFFEMLIVNTAKQIKLKTGDDYPKDKNKSHLGNLRYYIKNNLGISSKDDKLIDSFIDVLHKEGGHSFVSEKKYFSMTKNIGIEIAYFLLTNLDDFLASE